MRIASQYGVLLPSATPVLQGKRKFAFLAQCVTELEAFAVQQPMRLDWQKVDSL